MTKLSEAMCPIREEKVDRIVIWTALVVLILAWIAIGSAVLFVVDMVTGDEAAVTSPTPAECEHLPRTEPCVQVWVEERE